MLSLDAFLDRAGKEKKKCQYTDRLQTDAGAPVAPNRVHFLFKGKERRRTGNRPVAQKMIQ